MTPRPVPTLKERIKALKLYESGLGFLTHCRFCCALPPNDARSHCGGPCDDSCCGGQKKYHANISYNKIGEDRLKVVSASFQDSQGRNYPLLEGIVGKDYDSKNGIVAVIQDLASWEDDPPQINVNVHFTNINLNRRERKPTINSNALIELMGN
jgi:hypothetical protein